MKYSHYMALRWAVAQAAAWRGSLVGNPDTTALDAFDAQIKKCREALRTLNLNPYLPPAQ